MLLAGPLGFNELSRQASGINTTTLSQRLSLLEQHSLITRTVQPAAPPRISYELTEAGRALKKVIHEIAVWSESYLEPL
ncbi:MAG: helix-turn-helix transcriptional regulator [Fibrella sp.]|nr:helix-turn-helix transcriptional regulator [Armatimonadota bacterium]